MLISLSGLPGVGKTSVARELAQRLGAMHLRIDTIDQAMRDIGLGVKDDQSYRIAYKLAEDNLKLGLTVISDCVNDMVSTREAWRIAAKHAHAPCLEVDVICSDKAEHRRRVETRVSDIPNLVLPTWAEVQVHTVEPLSRERIVVDTAKYRPEEIADMLDWPIERAKRAFGIPGA